MKRSISFYLIVLSLIVIAIPVSFLGVTGITSLKGRGTPVIGNRFSNDQDPKISDKQLDDVIAKIKTLENVDDVHVNLATGTLRVYVLDKELSKDKLSSTGESIYNMVDSVLSVEDYFTKSGSKKQYDLEIHTFNLEKVNEENENDYVYGIYVKNANMEKPYSQTLTTPLSEEMVQFFIEEEEYNSRPIEEEVIDDNDEDEVEEEE